METVLAAHLLHGRLVGDNVRFVRVVTDTRAVEKGDLFVALKGDRFDGHDFVADAFERGAIAALVMRDRVPRDGGSLIEVDDPLAALGRLAAHWRHQFRIPVIVIVGSNGKTTVKEMVASILRAHFGEHVLATHGNLNNAIGLPLTLLGLRSTHRAAVIELGMNHPGETAELARIAQPTIALINNAQREHQEFMRSVADVAQEHASLLLHLPREGIAVLNADDSHVATWRAAVPEHASIVDFGLSHTAAVRGEFDAEGTGLRLHMRTPDAATSIHMHVAGGHNARNALGAAAAALAAGVSMPAVAEGLAAFRPVKGRLVARRGLRGQAVIDDTYNANPDSVRAAITVLAGAPSPRCLVLGDMGEVGDQGPAFHREAGEAARAAGVDHLFTVGTLAAEATHAFGAGAEHFDSVEALLRALSKGEAHYASVLIKGSRFMRMERVVAALCGDAAEGAH
ncbi:MAG: UDP-N-acetylmuramoyl-tripeptide--D-alanyl-D-alanine ligase [Pseudomonadota bacterium]|nr:UDP-N-acetylmuramoyl-tripeptide--D-alanyl-D-alanine ligase [Pseudomonadota bacterium]